MRGYSPMLGRSPKAVNAGPKPDAWLKPDAGPKPYAGLKPNAINVGPIGKCKKCKTKGCLLVVDFLQWEKETMKEHELFRISMKKLMLVSLALEGGSAFGPRLALPWRKGEGRKCPTREGWLDSPVVQGWVAGMNGLWSQHVSPWRGEDQGWSTCEGWHDLPVV
ncbi:hypothetical protein CRG98_003787 [Punica granatum]|uniref:Uncharacterized protein n=1 Tax=Punica granatum TaxID=22663 RepID=A0A2I0L5B0_PUNGR|nr:hypothetical protein CRG98_003787 [Punica granatum]